MVFFIQLLQVHLSCSFRTSTSRGTIPRNKNRPPTLFKTTGNFPRTVFPILSDTSRISPIPPWCSTRLVSSLSRQLLDVLNAMYYSISSLRVRRRVLRSMSRRADQPTDNRTNSRRAERDPSGVPAVVVDMVNDTMSRRWRRAIGNRHQGRLRPCNLPRFYGSSAGDEAIEGRASESLQSCNILQECASLHTPGKKVSIGSSFIMISSSQTDGYILRDTRRFRAFSLENSCDVPTRWRESFSENSNPFSPFCPHPATQNRVPTHGRTLCILGEIAIGY